MDAMTMDFPVKETNELKGIIAGDKITFRMLVTEDDGWIDQIKREGSASPAAISPVLDDEAGAVPFLQTGDIVPDLSLTNQLGQEFKLSDYRGQAVALTFIFTKCPFPLFCPLMNKNFSEAQKILSQNPNAANWQLLSISFDPKNDTPGTLASYASRYQYDPAHWTFATGPEERIRRLGASFGLFFTDKNGTIEHNLRTVVIDPSGRISRLYPNNDWKAKELAEAMTQAMEKK
jgi:protein SCO1/2